jgi:hypothetical protein
VLADAGGLITTVLIINYILNLIFFKPIDMLQFFFSMQEFDEEEDTKIEDEGRVRKYLEMQLNRFFGFKFELNDRLTRYQDICSDLLSIEYRLKRHNPMDEWDQENQ